MPRATLYIQSLKFCKQQLALSILEGHRDEDSEKDRKSLQPYLKYKKHSRTSPERQFKELNEKHRKLHLTSRSIEQCQPKQNHLKKSENKHHLEKQTIKQTRQK